MEYIGVVAFLLTIDPNFQPDTRNRKMRWSIFTCVRIRSVAFRLF